MKDTENSQQTTMMEDAEQFQSCFVSHQANIEDLIIASSTIERDELPEHFTRISSMLQDLQNLYSSSALYVRIYDRKVCQDTLQALQNKLQEAETRLMPRKKFVFKGKKAKSKLETPVSDREENKLSKFEEKLKVGLDVIDGPGTFVVRNKENETISLAVEIVSGKALLLSCLNNCKVDVTGAPSTVHIANVSKCSISCGPVATSVFVETARSCKMQLACQQLRIHETEDSDFLIHVSSRCIIEDCHRLRIGPYNHSYSTIDRDFSIAGLHKEVNNWKNVDDFNWLVVGQPSPNWSVIPTDES